MSRVDPTGCIRSAARVLTKITLLSLTLCAAAAGADFPPPLAGYGDAAMPGVWAKLAHRVSAEPLNLIATLIFLGAIAHTFLVARFRHVAHRCERELEMPGLPPAMRDRLRFRATLFHFLGEVEAVFGIWLVPLFIAVAVSRGVGTAVHYFDGVNYTEAIFVTVIMAMAGTRPVIVFAEACLARVARVLGGRPVSWWMADRKSVV